MRNGNGTARRAALAAALLLLADHAGAAGLRTRFGEVVVRGLKIGQSYSMHQLMNFPLRIVNTGDRSVDLGIQVIPVKEGTGKEGYEPIGELSWVRLEKTQFSLEPNHEAVTDVIIELPKDEALLGKRLEANIWSRTRSPQGALAVGMVSRLLIHVDSTPPTEEELRKKFVDRRLTNLDFTLLPVVGEVENLPVGREIDLKKEHKIAVKIVNPNDEALHFRVRSVPNWEAMLARPAGFVDAPDASWLKPVDEVLKVEGNSIRDTGLILSIPERPDLRGKSFLFAVAVDLLEQEIPTRVFYRLYASTAKE